MQSPIDIVVFKSRKFVRRKIVISQTKTTKTNFVHHPKSIHFDGFMT